MADGGGGPQDTLGQVGGQLGLADGVAVANLQKGPFIRRAPGPFVHALQRHFGHWHHVSWQHD